MQFENVKTYNFELGVKDQISNLNIALHYFRYLIKKKNFSLGFSLIILLIANGYKPDIFGLDLKEDMTNRSHYYQFSKIGIHHDLNL